MKRALFCLCIFSLGIVCCAYKSQNSSGLDKGEKSVAIDGKKTNGSKKSKIELTKSARKNIDNEINTAINEGVFPGAVFLVAKDGQIIYEKAYGYSQTVPAKVKMTTNTLFDIASLSKCVGTAPAVMQLIEQDKIKLEDPVKKYIPEFRPWSNGTEEVDITIRQLLDHTSGLDAGIASSKAVKLRKEWGGYNSTKAVNYIAKYAKRNFRPGTKCLYSCLNFITLQGIVEKVTSKHLCTYVKSNVWKPLGMENTYYFLEGEEIPKELNIASTEVVGGKTLNGIVHDPLARYLNGGNSGNAGVFTTAEDLAKYAFAILEGGKGMLKSKTVYLMTKVQNGIEKREGRSLGWEVNSSYCGKFKEKDYCICHTGYTGTSMVIDMDSKVVVILLTNRVHPKDLTEKKKALMKVRRALPNYVSDGLCM